MNTQKTNDKQAKPEEAKPVKRVLTVDALRHLCGMVVQTGIKGGQMWGMKILPNEFGR